MDAPPQDQEDITTQYQSHTPSTQNCLRIIPLSLPLEPLQKLEFGQLFFSLWLIICFLFLAVLEIKLRQALYPVLKQFFKHKLIWRQRHCQVKTHELGYGSKVEYLLGMHEALGSIPVTYKYVRAHTHSYTSRTYLRHRQRVSTDTHQRRHS